ncbi:MAG TPA: glycoside hydrolase, partial [Verrucomicrobiae bacterium]|nr:glycoside hydrolase [Verrucomicrobiae bacterium]
FQGVRISLFNYNDTGKPGGYADFDNFTVDEPRARGVERALPIGRTIILSSGADGSLLAVDTQKMSLVNIAADTSAAAGQNAQFQVVDLGQGHVALKTASSRLVSVADDVVILKNLTGKMPGEAEWFQWINLMRGDTMLMSLVNHRYLTTKPHNPGVVAISATGPRPDRKGGACFRWKTIQ